SKPSDTGRYNDIKLKILRFSRKGVGCGEGKNLFSREKKDNGADVRPPPRDTIDPCREQRENKKAVVVLLALSSALAETPFRGGRKMQTEGVFVCFFCIFWKNNVFFA
ncbi:MAG: hypothetical protein IKC65_09000, partial [Lentisphaeria bacterium]|nr:hypothetical protein [Lentisphaeria bacterium]